MRATKCPDCRGSGLNPRRPLHARPTCGGSGDMAAYTRHLTREMQRANRPTFWGFLCAFFSSLR